jgi:hypothetical protein
VQRVEELERRCDDAEANASVLQARLDDVAKDNVALRSQLERLERSKVRCGVDTCHGVRCSVSM